MQPILIPATTLKTVSPSHALRPFVTAYTLRAGQLGATQLYHPLPARSDCFLEFYLGERYRIVNVGSGATHRTAACVLVGPHTRRREDLIQTGSLHTFTIRFSPTGFHAVFGVPAHTLRDTAESAELVLGPAVFELGERLANAGTAGLHAAADTFLLKRLKTSLFAGEGNVAARIARALQRNHNTDLLQLARAHGRSLRQVERLFQDHVGLTPKMFARLTRLERVLAATDRNGPNDWAAIAAAAGYFDQSHLVHDFRSLTGEAPNAFLQLARNQPQA